ncbi:hypothetical protein Tco_0810135 [Tanacetum coccineum]
MSLLSTLKASNNSLRICYWDSLSCCRNGSFTNSSHVANSLTVTALHGTWPNIVQLALDVLRLRFLRCCPGVPKCTSQSSSPHPEPFLGTSKLILEIVRTSHKQPSIQPSSHGSSTMSMHYPTECTYKELLNCQPLNIKGTEGAVRLANWFEKMESVFHISSSTVECQVKYATCTLLGGALTWWKSHVRTVGHDEAYGTSWKSLMKMMTEAYCLRNEIQKLENELMLSKETNKVEWFIWGLPNSIQGNVTSSKSTRLQEAIELANSLMD